jgi:cation:H+ antiporter
MFSRLIFFLASCALLAGSGHLVVRSLDKILRCYKLREFIIGFILMAIVTSIPEIVVGVLSAMEEIPALSLGDIIGSNIVDLTLVISVVALLARKVKVESEVVKRDIYYMSIIALLPLILFLDQELSRLDGIVLLLVFSLYMQRLISQRERFRRIADGVLKKEIPMEVVILVIALIALLVSARFIVKFGALLAIDFALPPILIGLVIVSIGTSLPELSFETHSVLRGYSGMAMGDLLGSVIMNSTIVLGVASLIYPIRAHFPSFIVGSAFLAILLVLFSIFVKTEEEISWREGIALLFIYIAFITASLMTG